MWILGDCGILLLFPGGREGSAVHRLGSTVAGWMFTAVSALYVCRLPCGVRRVPEQTLTQTCRALWAAEWRLVLALDLQHPGGHVTEVTCAICTDLCVGLPHSCTVVQANSFTHGLFLCARWNIKLFYGFVLTQSVALGCGLGRRC